MVECSSWQQSPAWFSWDGHQKEKPLKIAPHGYCMESSLCMGLLWARAVGGALGDLLKIRRVLTPICINSNNITKAALAIPPPN